VFSDPLPSNGHGADHIENTSCHIFAIVLCASFGSCLEMGLHATIFTQDFPSVRLPKNAESASVRRADGFTTAKREYGTRGREFILPLN
jgi:hypothetical protein